MRPAILRLPFARMPGPDDWKTWIFIALLVKSSFFLYKCFEGSSHPNTHYPETFAVEGGDTFVYIDSIETLIKSGTYSNDFRMPGYGAVYYALRLFFPLSRSLNLMVVLQLALSALSIVAFARIASQAFKNDRYFYAVFITYAISTFTSLYDHVLLTDSFCTSALIFSIYFLLKEAASKADAFISGLILTWCIFLRPVTVPLLILFALFILLKGRGSRFELRSPNWKTAAVFLIPFVLIDGLWIARNFKRYNGFFPLMTKGLSDPGTALDSVTKFVNAYGGSTVYWEPGADMTFFIPLPSQIRKRRVVRPPEYIYTSKFNYDSLVSARDLIAEVDDPNTSTERKRLAENEVVGMLDSFTASIREEKPFLFYIYSRLRVLKTYFLHSGTYNLFSKASFELNALEFAVKVFYSLLYVSVVLFGFAGCAWLLFKGLNDSNFLLLSGTGLYFAFVFPFVFKMDEFRYFVPGYPFFLLAANFFILELLARLKPDRHNVPAAPLRPTDRPEASAA